MANPGLKRTDVNNGHAIAYRCAGQGPPLVLLHGFTLDSRIWRRQLEDLSDQFMVVAWDAPGAGASSDPPNPFTMADWAHCLAGFLDVMGIERAHILGMSLAFSRRSSIASIPHAPAVSYWLARTPGGEDRFRQ